MALTQARAFGAGTGGRYGSFAGKGAGEHPVDTLTQGRAFGAHSGQRYGSFEGRGGAGHPVGRLTQLRAFGPHSGARYGSFSGRGQVTPEPEPTTGGGYYRLPRRISDALRRRYIDEDELLLLMASTLDGNTIH